jgi:hypothetical protein
MDNFSLTLHIDSLLELWRSGRALARIDQGRRVAIAEADAVADIQAVKVDGLAYVGKVALQDTALLSQLEQQLAQLVPMATSRLQAIADITALGMAEVVTDTVRKLR